MTEYSESFRKRMVQRMAGLKELSVVKLATEVGVPQPTLSRWLRETTIVVSVAKRNVKPAATTARRPSDWPAAASRALRPSFASVPSAGSSSWRSVGASRIKLHLVGIVSCIDVLSHALGALPP